MMTNLARRAFLARTAAALPVLAAPGLARRAAAAEPEEIVAPVRTITKGPKFHWFAYYDKDQFCPTGRFALSNEVDFEHRSPTGDDVIRVGMVDLQEKDRWTELGASRAWNWQQGCMLQWVPGSADEVIWNDREGDRFVCHIKAVRSGKTRTLPHPVYALSPDGAWGVAPDFRRLNDTRPGYGYAGLPDPNRDVTAPDDAGIWKVDLKTGAQTLLFSFADIAKIEPPGGYSKGAKHWFNHLLVAPDGRRFVFLHRWSGEAEGKSWKTRMLSVDADGKNPYVLIPSGKVSHFVWRDARHILAYAGFGPDAKEWRFQVFPDLTQEAEVIDNMLPVDGHCTYVPKRNNEWILCDSYPDREKRNQALYLRHLPSNRRITIGRFHLPPEYKGEWRCDLHPRCNREGTLACIDSPHLGAGRQVHVVDLRGIVG
jgi:hypothetical protein